MTSRRGFVKQACHLVVSCREYIIMMYFLAFCIDFVEALPVLYVSSDNSALWIGLGIVVGIVTFGLMFFCVSRTSKSKGVHTTTNPPVLGPEKENVRPVTESNRQKMEEIVEEVMRETKEMKEDVREIGQGVTDVDKKVEGVKQGAAGVDEKVEQGLKEVIVVEQGVANVDKNVEQGCKEVLNKLEDRKPEAEELPPGDQANDDTALLGPKNVNYMRLLMLVTDKGTEVFRKVLLSITKTKCNVETFKEVLAIAGLNPNIIRDKQIRAYLWPKSGQGPETVDQLDMTACNSLLHSKEISDLTDNDEHETLKQELHKMRTERNDLCHSKTREYEQENFNEIFEKINKIFKEIATVFPECKISENDILNYKDKKMTKTCCQKMDHVIDEVLREAKEMNKDVKEMKEDVKHVQQDVAVIDKKVDDVAQCVAGVDKKIDNLVKQCEDMKTEQEKMPPDIDEQIQKALKDKYRDDMAYINCNPLEPDATTPIDKLFVKLTWIHEDASHKPGQEKEMKPLQHYHDIFEDQSENQVKKEIIHRILIQGRPGMGKTTFTKRLAVDWAEGKELSKRFENVFVLTLRKVQPGQTLVDIIAEQLLPYKSPLVQHLKTYIDQNHARCLFLFDGLDEMKQKTSREIDEMIKRNYLKNTCLVITSRPTQAQNLTTKTKIDQHARIDGFDEENVKKFIEKFFKSVYEMSARSRDPDNNDTSTALFKEIKREGLLDVAKIPLILNILCLLYNQDEKNRSLPENMSKIYERLQNLLCKRQKDEESENEENKAKFEDILQKLGRIAFEGLLKENNQLFFEKTKVQEEVGEDALKVGLICIEKAKYGLESNTQVYFLHKSFQEKIASFYLGTETDNNNDEPWEKLKTKMKTIQDIGEQELLLQFCAGASQKLAEQIFDFLDEKVNAIDPKLKAVLQLMEKLSQDKDLSKEELETVIDYDIGDDVKQILELEAKCLSNVEKPTEIRSHVVHRVFSNTENMKIARGKKILKPEKCIARILKDKELEDLVQSTTSVSWIKLEAFYGYSLTERTVRHLQDICDRNEHQVSVCIGDRSKADCTTMSKVMQLLQSNPKIKYKLVTFGTKSSDGIPYNNKYGREGWLKVLQKLLGIRYLVALNLQCCYIPDTVLGTIAQIINENADTLLQLDLRVNIEIRTHFDELSRNIQNQLSLTVLKLSYCLDPSDTDALRNLLEKCKHIEVLDVSGCKCEISRDILKLKNIKEINIGDTVDERTGRGLDVRQVLANLDKVEMLEVIDAEQCQLDDSQIKNIPFNKPSKVRKLDLNYNLIGSQGLQYLCEHHTMLPELEEIWLHDNEIGDEGGQVLMEHLQLFKNLRELRVVDTGISEDMSKRIKEKGNKCGIACQAH